MTDIAFWAEPVLGVRYAPEDTLQEIKHLDSKKLLISGAISFAVAVLFSTLAAFYWLDSPVSLVVLEHTTRPALAANHVASVVLTPIVPVAAPMPARLPVVAKPPVIKPVVKPRIKHTALVKPAREAGVEASMTDHPAIMPEPAIRLVIKHTAAVKVPREDHPAIKPVPVVKYTAESALTRNPVPVPEPAFPLASKPVAVTKPVDMATAGKFGLRDISATDVTLLNGSHVKTGDRLPNGEMLMTINKQIGSIETDHRIMVLLP